MDLALATQDSAPATKGANVRSSLAVASRQVMLLIALGYGISYIVPACFSFASLQVNEESRSSAFVHGPGFNLHAELVCESAPRRLLERSACELPK